MKLNKNLIINISFALSLLILTLIVYIITLSRSVYFGDSGEFIAVAKTLGIAHPPGYPLYTMLAHLFTYLPFGNLPFKVNLFSAVTSSLTVVVVYFICLKLTKNRLAAVSASLFLAFSYLFWLYSLVAEVFSLNNLFVALIILISLH
ncbi:MAG: Transmembrane protein, partial [Candidatus Curtissbacteria bacterium GW2011_GWA2_41_24]